MYHGPCALVQARKHKQVGNTRWPVFHAPRLPMPNIGNYLVARILFFCDYKCTYALLNSFEPHRAPLKPKEAYNIVETRTNKRKVSTHTFYVLTCNSIHELSISI